MLPQFRSLLRRTGPEEDGFEPRNASNVIWALAKLHLRQDEGAMEHCIAHMRRHPEKLEYVCASWYSSHLPAKPQLGRLSTQEQLRLCIHVHQ